MSPAHVDLVASSAARGKAVAGATAVQSGRRPQTSSAAGALECGREAAAFLR